MSGPQLSAEAAYASQAKVRLPRSLPKPLTFPTQQAKNNPPITSRMSVKLRISTTLPDRPSPSRTSTSSDKKQPHTEPRSPVSPLSGFLFKAFRKATKSKQNSLARRATLPATSATSASAAVSELDLGSPRPPMNYRSSVQAVFRRRLKGEVLTRPELSRDDDLDLDTPQSPSWRLDATGSPTGFGSPLERFTQLSDRIDPPSLPIPPEIGRASCRERVS